MTIEQLFATAHAQGLRVLNLFERDDGCWQANFRRERDCFAFGTGATPVEALQKALAEYDGFQKQLAAHRAVRQPQPALEDIFG